MRQGIISVGYHLDFASVTLKHHLFKNDSITRLNLLSIRDPSPSNHYYVEVLRGSKQSVHILGLSMMIRWSHQNE